MLDLQKIRKLIYNYEYPERIALSSRFPIFKKPILLLRYIIKYLQVYFNSQIQYKKSNKYFGHIVARHQSVLRRKLGNSDPRLQEQKIQNLKIAVKELDGVIIEPGKIFSFWQILGKPTAKKGYVNGMLLANGKVIEGIGGGLCQLSNFLHWIFLHIPSEIVERYHHAMDVFPDSGRVLPFGSGATILYNFVDLQIKNISKYPIQLKLWLSNNHLKGQILSIKSFEEKYHIFEKNHCFIKRRDNLYFRYNEIWREMRVNGILKKTEHIVDNFAPVLYEIDEDYLKKLNYKLYDFSKLDLFENKELENYKKIVLDY